MQRNFQEERILIRWREEVCKPFYDYSEDEKKCLEYSKGIIEEVYKNIDLLSNACLFTIFVGYSQILIENKQFEKAEEILISAENYMSNNYDRACLCWRKAELYIEMKNEEKEKDGKSTSSLLEIENLMECSKVLYEEALKFFESLRKEDVELKKYRNALAIKHQFSKHFKIYKHAKEIMLIYINLYLENIESLKTLGDTYETFKKLATSECDYMFLSKVKKILKENGIDKKFSKELKMVL